MVCCRIKQRLDAAEAALRNKKGPSKEQRVRNKFNKFRPRPLPVTLGVQFRGLSGKLRKETTFSQIIAVLFKFVHSHYAYRADCFRFCIHEELADIAQACQVWKLFSFLYFILSDILL
jgi:hypothetical protein